MSKWRDYLEPGDDAVALADVPGPERDVPRALGVLFGSQLGWSPEREGQKLGHCKTCGNGHLHTPIRPGSRIVCMGCGRYGLDSQIKALLAVTPAKPRSRPHVPPPKPAVRKDRRIKVATAINVFLAKHGEPLRHVRLDDDPA